MLKYVPRPARPSGHLGRPTRYPYDAVLGTLTTDQAVLYPASSPAAVDKLIEAMRRKLRRQGLRLGRQRHAKGVLLWVEKGEGA